MRSEGLERSAEGEDRMHSEDVRPIACSVLEAGNVMERLKSLKSSAVRLICGKPTSPIAQILRLFLLFEIGARPRLKLPAKFRSTFARPSPHVTFKLHPCRACPKCKPASRPVRIQHPLAALIIQYRL